MDESELAVAHWVYQHRQLAGLGTATLPGARALYLPLVGSRGAVGVLGMSPADAHALESPEQLHQLETFANQMALAIERAQASEDARRAEVRAEAERLRNSLLSSVSHDLRTPLASITGAASSLLEAGDQMGDATRKELLSSIHQEAERLDRLVNNLLEMTRLEAGGVVIRKEWQPLEGVLGAALKRLEGRLRDREVHIDLPGDLPLVPIDAMLVEQVLVNILENAAKYTPAGSPIDISAASVGAAVRVDIADHGPGFATGEEERMFDKFYREPGRKGPRRRARPRDLAAPSSARTEERSGPSRGPAAAPSSTSPCRSATLHPRRRPPMDEARRPPGPADAPDTAALSKKPVVVLIEDEPEIRRFLRASLTGHGYRLFEATTGAEGLREAESRQPDVVVLDLGLPDIDGLEVIRRLREWTGVPIIVLSARGPGAGQDRGARRRRRRLRRQAVRRRRAARAAPRVAAPRRARGARGGEPTFSAGDLEVDRLSAGCSSAGKRFTSRRSSTGSSPRWSSMRERC